MAVEGFGVAHKAKPYGKDKGIHKINQEAIDSINQ